MRSVVKLTVDIPSSHRPPSVSRLSPSRWATPEFKFYGVMFILVVPFMFWIPVSLSLSSHPNYALFRDRLSPGWIFGRQIDNSDAQYHSFRNNLPLLALAVLGHLSAKFLYTRLTPSKSTPNLIPFTLFFSILAITGLHGTNILKIGLILLLNYAIAKRTGNLKTLGPIITWTHAMGYHFASLSNHLAFLDIVFQGAYPRWHIIFNITMLRLISFNMDYYWSRTTELESKGISDRLLTEKGRQTTPHTAETYTFTNYLTYVLYPPLYIGGPIMSFNDFMWQHRQPLNTPTSTIRSYMIRFIACLLTMELILHFMYVVAIKDTKAWVGYTPAQISMVGFWNLIIVWLKLLIPWRFFRLWALLDGIDPPENMVRCMANNYSTLGFWRSWHRSYNLWIIRYIYVPLGGKNNIYLNIVLIFSFALFIVPEIIAALLLPENKYGKEWWYRHVCALGAVVNVLMMMTANLVGFVVGVDGIRFFLSELMGSIQGIQYLVFIVVCLFIGVQVMFEYREEELRNGISRRC
ncbi:MBOAT, membrane-bound O-acyltransferase family-domain-containing protein [Amanita rubescens]|nr:MBOAT, membrane-bound O-acyltransferase family-domain-containing protein [Amanita rubescens]